MTTRLLPLIALASALLAACGGAAAPAASTAPATQGASTPPAAAATASAATAGGWTVTSASKATVTVREQLVGVNLPSDAVLAVAGAAGSFSVNADGSFTSDSKITFDVTTLASNESQRDNFIKQSTLQTRQFPTATFVPTKATGVTLPLASNADLKFTLTGKLTIHGVTKDVTFDVVGTRAGSQLAATATAPTLKFEDFGMTTPSVPLRVVSVTDEIHLVVALVATAPV